MYFEENETPARHFVSSYDEKSVTIDNRLYTESILLLPDSEPRLWKTDSFENLEFGDFSPIFDTKPDLLIVGCGNQQRFLSPRVITEISQRNAVECMVNPSACRTFNLLVSEDRKVALALFMENSD